MANDSGAEGSSRLLLVIIIAVVAVMGLTVFLNGGTSTTPIEENDTNDTNTTDELSLIDSVVIADTDEGSVVKYGTYGNTSSPIKIAFIVGINQENDSISSVISTLDNQGGLHYAYDIYMINATKDDSDNGSENNSNTSLLNDNSVALAKEYVVPEITNGSYNLSVEVHSSDDGNSYVYVPSENTVTSKKVVNEVSNKTGLSSYTPNSTTFTNSVSTTLLEDNVASIVYVTKDYYLGTASEEISSVLAAIDVFDFANVTTDTNDDNDTNYTNSSDSSNTTNTSTSYDTSNSSRSSNNYSNENSSNYY